MIIMILMFPSASSPSSTTSSTIFIHTTIYIRINIKRSIIIMINIITRIIINLTPVINSQVRKLFDSAEHVSGVAWGLGVLLYVLSTYLRDCVRCHDLPDPGQPCSDPGVDAGEAREAAAVAPAGDAPQDVAASLFTD